MLLFYVFFVQKEQTFVQIFRKEGDVFLTFQDVFWEIRPAVMLNFNQIE